MIVNLFFFNRCFDKSRLKILISWSLKNYGEKNTIELVESLKQLGFEYATQAGISLSLDDLKIPPTKSSLVSEAEIKIHSTQLEYKKGHLTAVEKFQQLIDTWHRTSETLKQNVVQHFRSTNILNPVYMMAFSGARGNLSQVRQLVGMRGLMADPQGQIIDFPIRSNFREGLTLTEYVISCYGARKGLVDTALRTANSGYLTRRLVDVSQHVIVCQLDCGTRHGIFLSDMKQGQKTILSLEDRLIGRVLAENINFFTHHKREIESQDSPMFSSEDPNRVVLSTKDVPIDIIQEGKLSGNLHVADKSSQNEFQQYLSGQKLQTKKSKNKYYFSKKSVLIARNQEISPSLAAKIVKLKKKVLVRSPLTCEAKNSICQLCYGWSLAHGNLVSLGEAVGILAAQSIGEPGTQLTMRTFHTGGVFSGDVMEEIRAPFTGIIKYSEALQGLLVRTPHGKVAFLTKTQGELILTSFSTFGSQRVDHKGLPSKMVELNSSQLSTPTNSQMLGDKVKKFQIPSSTILFVRESEVVLENQLIAEFSSMSTQSNQRIQAKHNLNSELEGQIFFEDVLLGMKIGKEGDITRTARKLGSIWVLSGKLYQSMLPSVFFPKAGDLIDTKSIMNQTLVLIPYNGFLNSNRVLPSEIVAQNETNLLSTNIQNKSFAISDDNKMFESTKKYVSSNSYKTKLFSYDSSPMKTGRMKILNKKNIVSKKNLFYSSLLPKSKSKVTTLSDDRTKSHDFSGNYLKIRNFSSKLAKDIILSNSIGSLNLKSIRYKKYGYFLDLCPNPVFGEPTTIFSKLSKNCENEQNFSASKPVFTKTPLGRELNLSQFFLCNSIEQEFKDVNQIKKFFYLQWFPKNYKTKSGGFLFLENNYLNENSTEGQFFWVQEENYKFNKQKLFFPKKSQLKDFFTIESNKVFAPEEDGNRSLLPSAMVELNKILPSEMIAQEKIEDLTNKNSDISKLSQVKKLDSNYIFSRQNYAIKKQLYSKRSKLLFSEYLAKQTNFPNRVPFSMDEHSRIKNSRFIDSKRILAQKDSRIVINEDSKKAVLTEKNEQAENFLLLDSPSEIKIQTKWIKKDSPIISKSNFQGNPLVFFSNFSGLAVIHKPKKNLSQKNVNIAFLKLFKNKIQTKRDFSIYNDKMRIQQDLKIRECSTIYDGTIKTQKKLSTTPYDLIGNGRPSESQDGNKSKILSYKKSFPEKKIKKFFCQNPGTIFGKNTYFTKSQKQKLFLGNFRVFLTPQLPFSEINIFTNYSSLYLKDEPIKLSFTSQNNFVLSKKRNLEFSSLLNYKKDLFKQIDYLQKNFLSSLGSQRVARKGLPLKMVELDLIQKGYSSSQLLTSQEDKLRSSSDRNKTSNFKNTSHERKKTSSNINNFIQVTIKPGWIYFPKNQKYVTKYHQSLQRPGSHFVDDIIFDQHMIYSECFSTKNYPLSYFCKLNSNKVLPSEIVAQEQKSSTSSTIDSNKVVAQEENGQMSILSSQIGDSKVKNKNLYLKKLLNFSEIAIKINESTFAEDYNLNINNGSKQIQNTLNSFESTRRDDEIFTRQKKLKRLHEFLQLFFFSSQRINQKRKNLITPFKKILDARQTKKLLLNCDIFLMSFYFTQFLFIGKTKNFNLLKIYFIENTKHRFCKFLNSTFLTKIKTSSLDFQKVIPKNQDSNRILIHEKLYSNIDSNKVLAQKERKLVSRFYPLDTQMLTQKSKLSSNNKIRVNTFSSTIENGSMSIGESFSCFFRGEFKPKLFILVRKASEYTLVDSSQNKKLVDETNQLQENGVTPNFENFQLKITSLPWFNKQKITKLISTFPAVDFQVDSFLRFKTSHKNRVLKQTNFLEIFVSFLIPSKYPLKSTKINIIPQIVASNSKLFSLVPTHLVYQKMATQSLQWPSSGSLPRGSSTRSTKQKNKKGSPLGRELYSSLLYFNAFNNLLNFSVFRKIELSSFLISEVKNNNNTLKSTQLLLYSNNWTFKTNPLSLTCFFSPYEGEITNIKTDSFGKQSCLFLTNNDQLSFSTPLPNLSGTIFQQKDSLSSWTRTLDESSKFEIPCVQVGQLMRYGEEFMQNIAITASGQIIQVENSKVVLRKAQPILFSSRGVFHVYHKDFVEKNSPLLTLFYQRLKTGDIVQGIPQIEQFFEARQTKEGEILPENLHTKLREFFEISKQHFSPQEAARRSLEKIQQLLVDGVQKVYQSQGVTIADKHLEVIIRQMTSKVKILEGGQTGLLRGELIDLDWIEVVNKGINSQKAEYEPVILGITKAALETESFISAASFQETTRILARAAIERKTDFLRGLKENVILGHLIPAGTGFSLSFDPEISKYSDKNKNKNENFFTNVFRNLDIQNTN
jgi:DNA-directed RNA polymerase subunit beta'